MQAVTYHGAKDFRVEEVADPRIEVDDDVILRVTSTARGHKIFNDKEDQCRKVVLRP